MTDYIGRFAPSPTGLLHLGSLVAAVGSYLRAKSQQGQWLVRMENLDPLREVSGAMEGILRSLEDHGLEWDGEVLYQQDRTEAYQAVLEQLISQGDAYLCECSRQFLRKTAVMGDHGVIYPSNCREKQLSFSHQGAIRVRTHNQPICFTDFNTQQECQHLESELGDFIIKRSDGYFAYQLAVVVDDEMQGITEVVRGQDLQTNTQRQIHLQQLLSYSSLDYYHLPLMLNKEGQKLSKHTHAEALDSSKVIDNLMIVLDFLGIELGVDRQDIKELTPQELLAIAVTC
ncbi:MAG: tRNA glutamyl-Q(34) synthetase GluQRS [Thiotrichaceae bacterium]|nr:tRNA glutamyl-Q(34) synthetase GluQRS [Thiotrichaceae bacterium]